MGAGIALADLATTLLAGREPLAERLAFPAADAAEVRAVLAACGRGETPPAVRRGTAGKGEPDLLAAWTRGGLVAADAWVVGAAVPPGPFPWGGRRVALPGRAFERRSYWSGRARPGAVAPDPARLLAEHKDALALEASAMRRGIDAKDVKAVLRHALAMLEELRTSSLTPKVRARARRRPRAGRAALSQRKRSESHRIAAACSAAQRWASCCGCGVSRRTSFK
jgi:acyl transferase domain-containing protein